MSMLTKTHRLQVLISESLDNRISTAARRAGVSKGEFVRQAIEKTLRREGGEGGGVADPLERLGKLRAPTADIEEMLAEIEAGRV